MSTSSKRPAQPHSCPEPKRPRSYSMCENCRKQKKACNPTSRDWAAGERCGNCVKSNLECGPNRKHNETNSGGGGGGGVVVGTGVGVRAASSSIGMQLAVAAPNTTNKRPILAPRPIPNACPPRPDTTSAVSFSQQLSGVASPALGYGAIVGQNPDRLPLQIQGLLNNG